MQEIKQSAGDRNIASTQSNIQATNFCHQCEGKGYISIRDCSSEIQREENCSYCRGTGKI